MLFFFFDWRASWGGDAYLVMMIWTGPVKSWLMRLAIMVSNRFNAVVKHAWMMLWCQNPNARMAVSTQTKGRMKKFY